MLPKHRLSRKVPKPRSDPFFRILIQRVVLIGEASHHHMKHHSANASPPVVEHYAAGEKYGRVVIHRTGVCVTGLVNFTNFYGILL